METNVTRSGLAESFRKRYPTRRSVFLTFGGCDIEVMCGDANIADGLIDYFGPFVSESTVPAIRVSVHEAPVQEPPVAVTPKPPEPGKTRIKELFADIPGGRVVKKRLTGMLFVFGGEDNVGVGPCLANMNQVVNFVINRYIEWRLRKGCLLGHAAAVTVNGRGIAVAGIAGAGKSTLSLHLMRENGVFVSNDRLMVEQAQGSLVMHGVPKLPRINPGTALNHPDLSGIVPEDEREAFSSLPEKALWNLEHKYDVPIETCFGSDRFVLKAPMHGLAILNWKLNGGETRVKEVRLDERKDLLPAFMKSPGLFYFPGNGANDPGDAGPDDYAALLKPCPVLEFSGGVDFDMAVQACLDHFHAAGD